MLDFSSDMMVKGKSVLGSLEIQMRLLDLQNHVTINKINKVGWSLTAGCSPPREPRGNRGCGRGHGLAVGVSCDWDWDTKAGLAGEPRRTSGLCPGALLV